jgi:hypothetical protein
MLGFFPHGFNKGIGRVGATVYPDNYAPPQLLSS